MSVLSKVINSQLQNYSCRTIVHPGQTCTNAFISNIINYYPRSAKFFFPFALVPLLMNIKKMNRKIFMKYFTYFLELSFAAYSVGIIITSLMCIFRNFSGRFNYRTIVFFPTLIATTLSFSISKRVARIFAISLSQILFEAQMRGKSNIIVKIISESKFIQTLLFMLCSSIIIPILKDLKDNKKHNKVFWFIKPTVKIEKSVSKHTNQIAENNILAENFNINIQQQKNDLEIITKTLNSSSCSNHCHDENCITFLIKGIKSYFLIGFALESIKILLSKASKQNLLHANNFHLNLLLNIFKSYNWNTTKFLVSYIALYRASNCFLNNYYANFKSNHIHRLSSLLGGLSYLFCPKPMLLGYALTSASELIWNKFTTQQKQNKYNNIVKSEFIKKITSNISASRLLIIPALSFMLHLYIFKNHLINNLGCNIADAATNRRAWEVHSRIKTILEHSGFQI